jgi:large subunit ribosomal protein L23
MAKEKTAKTTKKTKKPRTASETSDVAVKHYGIIISPVITEKSSLVGASGSNVVFKVHRDANKKDIREAVQALFKVKVISVRTCSFIGKKKRTAKGVGIRAGYRKAYVTLAEGQTIDVVEGL